MRVLENGLFLVAGLLCAHLFHRFQEPHRVFNFSAGPGTLPVSVLKEAQEQLLDYEGRGMSFMEMSHRDAGGPVQSVMQGAQDRLREIMKVPDTHDILYMHGGAHAQFSAVPMNLSPSDGSMDYVVTGYWSDRAAGVAAKHVNVQKVTGAADGKLLPVSDWALNPNTKYVHICASETIDGLEFLEDPVLPEGKLLVGDFTSTLLSRPVDFSKYAVVYASGGKNLGPAGFTLVIVRKDLLGESTAQPHTPPIMNYHLAAIKQPINSIYNTPPTFPIYMHSLVLRHLEEAVQEKSGSKDVAVMEFVRDRAVARAKLVYDVIDQSNGFYRNAIAPQHRSRMNVPCRIGEGRLDMEKEFVKAAEEADGGLYQLFGHPVRGGLRVTLYLGVSDEAVQRVVTFMQRFAEENAARLA